MHDEFERAMLAEPDNLDVYAVYADWLCGQGDARGEFIQLQLRLELDELDPDQRAQVRAREQELFDAHGRDWLGPLAEPLLDHRQHTEMNFRRVRYARGLLESIESSTLDAPLLLALREAAETRFLRRLRLLDSEYIEEPLEIDGEEIGEDDSLLPYLADAPLSNLREFQLGGLEPTNCHTNGEGVTALLAKTPKLEHLTLMAHNVDTEQLFQLSLPKLKQLAVYHVHQYPLELLAANPSMALLEHIDLRPHAVEFGEEPYLRIEHLRAVIESPHLRNLRHLELRSANFGDAGVRMLVDSPLFQRIESLNLVYGEIGDDGARVLAAHPHTRELSQLNLTGNMLTRAGLDALRQAGVSVVSHEQFGPGDPPEYYWRGDVE